jgi:hypothetical protein
VSFHCFAIRLSKIYSKGGANINSQGSSSANIDQGEYVMCPLQIDRVSSYVTRYISPYSGLQSKCSASSSCLSVGKGVAGREEGVSRARRVAQFDLHDWRGSEPSY